MRSFTMRYSANALRDLPSKRLVVAYIVDWIVIIAIAAVGGGWNSITPYRRPFSVTDLSISFPYQDELIKTWILLVVSLVAPAAIIFLVCLLLVPGPGASRGLSRRAILRRKFWELNAGWMGLALSLATAFMATQGLKLVFGKPRPHLLAVCDPDVDAIAANAVGSYATAFSSEWVLVGSGICRQADKDRLNDAFKSFPSGHASFSWSGLLYLSLFMCSKFAIAIPFLPTTQSSATLASADHDQQRGSLDSLLLRDRDGHSGGAHAAAAATEAAHHTHDLHNHAAAPPTWTVALALVPVALALYVCSTRYAQFYHFGVDVLAGSVVGVLSAYASFRLYHMPVSRGAGWAWGPRSRDRAFGIGVGVLGYVGPEGWGPAAAAGAQGKRTGEEDVEMGVARGKTIDRQGSPA